MPRKALKSEKKPPLLFLERSVCGATHRNVPEVRAALNPKDYFAEKPGQTTSASNSWVSPQFDISIPAAPSGRRGRKKCLSTTSVLGNCSQLPRKTSVCKFPVLSFETRSRGQSQQAKGARRKKGRQPAVVPDVCHQPQGSCRMKETVSSVEHSETPKRKTMSIMEKSQVRLSGCDASSSRSLDQLETPSVTASRKILADASEPACNEFNSSVGPPPDVDTPKLIGNGSSGPSSTHFHLLVPEQCTSPYNRPPDILVADTPERDYDLKVTWRRRKGFMEMSKDRGHLSDLDVLIRS